MQNALVSALASYQTFGPMSIAVRYMALTRKGMTPDRLRRLLHALSPNLPDMDFDALLQGMQDQIYVKRLPDDSLVLHDKVAEWAEAGLYAEGDPIAPYQALVDIYQEEINALNQQINRLIPIADPAASAEEFDERFLTQDEREEEDPLARTQARELQEARRRRRNLVIEQMTYALRGAPERGYRIYYELAEEAFNVGRMDYEAQIRSEFLGWWQDEQPPESGHYKYRTQARDAGVNEEIIQADFAIRAVQRTYSIVQPQSGRSPTDRARATVELVNEILRTVATPGNQLTIPPYARILLHVYADMSRGRLATNGQEIQDVRQAFANHIDQVNALLQSRGGLDQKDDLETFLLMSTQAFAYYELGFFERNRGNFGEAIRYYTRSLLPYRELGFEMNQARSLNDKAFALATIGNSQEADTAVNDALTLRKRLGFSYPIGLSYNTRGIVHTLSDRPVSALQNCYSALRIFQSLSDEYGQMITFRAMAEASRRDAERVIDNRRRYHERLQTALNFSATAADLADKLLTDNDAFKADVLIEHGSVWRDLARLYWQYPDLMPANSPNPQRESSKLLERAIHIASAIPGAGSQLVDAMVDRAYLHYYETSANSVHKATILRQAGQMLDEALAKVPAEYRDPSSPDHPTLANNLSVYWSLLCKAHSLRVTLEKEWLLLSSSIDQGPESPKPHEDRLLRAAILTLYFRSLLSSNVRNVRLSNQVIYEAFQNFPANALERFHAQADSLSESLGLPDGKRNTMRKFLEDNYGVEPVH
ncbi:MAG: tetratricopeptide repeat protein [Caldilineaceae bacterium]